MADRSAHADLGASLTGLSLSDVIGLLDSFLHPVFDSLLSVNDFNNKWSVDKKRWELNNAALVE